MLTNFLSKFKEKKILVIGDIMLDKYIWGSVDRISPEAPVPVVKADYEEYLPGGAANVANNIAALGAKVFMVGLLGGDNAGFILSSELNKRTINTDGINVDKNKPTIQKIRVIGQKQQLLRIDYEKVSYQEKDYEEKTLKFISDKIKQIDAIIVSDYAKGVITKNLMQNLIELCKTNKKIIVVDPKPKHIAYYKDATLITPNTKEAYEITNLAESYDEDINVMGNKIIQKTNSDVLITRGEKGMSLFEKDGKITHIPTKTKEVYDVTGAGDTVVAVLALSLASGASTEQAAIIANHAAGIVVGKIGTSTASIAELKTSLENE